MTSDNSKMKLLSIMLEIISDCEMEDDFLEDSYIETLIDDLTDELITEINKKGLSCNFCEICEFYEECQGG